MLRVRSNVGASWVQLRTRRRCGRSAPSPNLVSVPAKSSGRFPHQFHPVQRLFLSRHCNRNLRVIANNLLLRKEKKETMEKDR